MSDPRYESLPYYPISRFYRNRFQGKIYKVPISVAEDCPNRRGLKNMKTCIFCDEWGSAAHPEDREESVTEQVRIHQARLKNTYKAEKFLVYFQAYTNTFMRLQDLRARMDEALACPDVVGIVLGTRPDCLSAGVLKTWHEYSQKTFVGIELGVQSFEEKHLDYMKRGHDAKASIDAIHRIKSETDVDLGIHLMFGWPDETADEVVRAAEICSSLPIDNVKIHNVHVLKNTPLEEIYKEGNFTPIELEDFSQLVMLFLQNLKPDIAVHRLGAVASRWEELVAPHWASYKMRIYQYILDYIREREAFQGQKYIERHHSQVFTELGKSLPAVPRFPFYPEQELLR